MVELQETIKERNVSKEVRNLRKSKAQVDHINSHPHDSEWSKYTIEEIANGEFRVTNNENNRPYLVSPNAIEQCDMDKCKIKCTKCGPDPICRHSLTCNCRVSFQIPLHILVIEM